jgi:hypothetical protein
MRWVWGRRPTNRKEGREGKKRIEKSGPNSFYADRYFPDGVN